MVVEEGDEDDPTAEAEERTEVVEREGGESEFISVRDKEQAIEKDKADF